MRWSRPEGSAARLASRCFTLTLMSLLSRGPDSLLAPAGRQRLLAQSATGATSVRTVTDTLPGAVGGVSVDRLGTIYVADFRETVWKVTPAGTARVFASGLYGASGNALDSRGNLYQSSFWGNYITRIDRHGRQEIVADSGLNGPVGITIDDESDLLVCNCQGNSLGRVTLEGEVSVFATSNAFNCPNGITPAADGNLYVANFHDGRVLRVTPKGEVGLFATLPGGGNGHITFARGSLYATSFRGQRIYRITLGGEVTLLAGTGVLGEDDGPPLEATFRWPNGIAAGPLGDRLYVNDFVNRFPPTVEAPPQPLSWDTL